MKFANDPLWQKIDTFPLDDPAFTQKLAKENNWTPHFTERAISEYKRFIYLCCIMPDGASPPPVVDEVWHLHILYTVNYWEEFCDRTLGRKLHHHPSRGGPEEKERHVNWLADTVQNYRLIFEEEPPSDIWETAIPDIPLSPPSQKKNYRLGVIIVVVAIIVMILVWQSNNFLLIPFFALCFVGFMINDSPAKKGKNSDSGTGGGCSSGGDSSCGSSCGCGGCGGCGGD